MAMVDMSAEIRSAAGSDLLAMLPLLQRAGLPTDDLRGSAALELWVVDAGGALLGAIGLERFGRCALLRSLIVVPGQRRCGWGRQLVARLERHAQRSGVQQLVLLTETAEKFFAALRYAVIDRQHVPDALKRSPEFQTLCPVSAVCMTKILSTQTQD